MVSCHTANFSYALAKAHNSQSGPSGHLLLQVYLRILGCFCSFMWTRGCGNQALFYHSGKSYDRALAIVLMEHT
jgi:hypothetical protein